MHAVGYIYAHLGLFVNQLAYKCICFENCQTGPNFVHPPKPIFTRTIKLKTETPPNLATLAAVRDTIAGSQSDCVWCLIFKNAECDSDQWGFAVGVATPRKSKDKNCIANHVLCAVHPRGASQIAYLCTILRSIVVQIVWVVCVKFLKEKVHLNNRKNEVWNVGHGCG